MTGKNEIEPMKGMEARTKGLQIEGGYTSTLHAQMKGGKLVSVTDGEPIELDEGTFVQLAIIGSQKKLWTDHPLLMEEATLEFLPKGSRLFFGSTNKAVTRSRKSFFLWQEKFCPVSPIDPDTPIQTLPERFAEVLWIEFNLIEGACLRLRGDREARLLQCRVYIPAFETTEQSLNSPVSRVIGMTQKNRKTNSSNVFRTCVALINDVPVPLDELRTKVVETHRKDRKEQEAKRAETASLFG